jgi:hypothetical protein
MHVLFIDIWMTVSDYNTNPTIIILVGIGILTKCMFYLFISGWLYQTILPIIIRFIFWYLDDCVCIRQKYQSDSNYTSWDWNLTEMHVLIFNNWMTVSDYSSNGTVIILVGIGTLQRSMFYLLISGWLYQTIIQIPQ